MREHGEKLVLGLVCCFSFLFCFTQLALGLSLFGKITEHQDYSTHDPLGIANRRATIVDWNFSAVFTDQQSVVAQADDDPVLYDLLHRIFHRLACVFV